MTLRARGLRVAYGARPVLNDLDLHVAAGEIVAVLGASGSGKSSLLRALCGLIPSSGSIQWGDQELSQIAPHKRQIGLMFQDHALFDHLSVTENVAFGLKMQGVERSARLLQAEQWLEIVGLAGFDQRRIASLSGGEQQRVALARALACAPRALLLDEPFGALDPTLRARLALEVRELVQRHSIAAMLVTHDHGEAFLIADRVAVLIDQRIAQMDTPTELWSHPVSVAVCAALGFGPPSRGVVTGDSVDCGWATLPCRRRDATHVEVVLRPDAFTIIDDGVLPANPLAVATSAMPATLRARVQSIVPHGDRLEATVRVGDGPLMRVAALANIHVGAEVQIAINPDAVLCY